MYLPEKNKIMLCANTMMRSRDFDNASSRQLIFMYDHNRSLGSGGNYDLNKCKHLACSEVRAALFTDECKVRQSGIEVARRGNSGEKSDV